MSICLRIKSIPSRLDYWITCRVQLKMTLWQPNWSLMTNEVELREKKLTQSSVSEVQKSNKQKEIKQNQWGRVQQTFTIQWGRHENMIKDWVNTVFNVLTFWREVHCLLNSTTIPLSQNSFLRKLSTLKEYGGISKNDLRFMHFIGWVTRDMIGPHSSYINS